MNQKSLDETYTDSFGRTKTLDLRNDLQLNKVNLYFKGWIYDPKFSYMFFAWTQNAQMGDGAQVVIGGGLDWSFRPQLNIGAGVTQNPGTRSLRGTFPYWHSVDTRLIADEYHRPSYTTGFYVYGNLANNLQYKAVLGNNLSQLGVNAVQLDANFNTVSTSLTWSPQGEFGPRAGWGDFETHDEVVTNFGLGLTRSREDRQSQPLESSIENSQIRLSDGTRLFEDDAFGTGGRVNRATYRMLSLDAGMKYRGFDVSGGYYARWVDDFETEGVIPVEKLHDWGWQIQASMMVVPQTLQVYVGYSNTRKSSKKMCRGKPYCLMVREPLPVRSAGAGLSQCRCSTSGISSRTSAPGSRSSSAPPTACRRRAPRWQSSWLPCTWRCAASAWSCN